MRSPMRLVRAKHENRLDWALQQLAYPKVLILDKLGYLPLTRDDASLFFRLVVWCYERASLIVTSNKSCLDWGEVFSDQVLATAQPEDLPKILHIRTQHYGKASSVKLTVIGRPTKGVDHGEVST